MKQYKTEILIKKYLPIVERLISDAEKATGIEHNPTFVEKSRKEKYLFLRYAVIYHLHKNFYLSANAISKIMNCDHTTIDNALSQVKYLSISKHTFRDIMRTVYDCVLKMKDDDDIIQVMREITRYKKTGAVESGNVYDSSNDYAKIKSSSGYEYTSYDNTIDRETLLISLHEYAMKNTIDGTILFSIMSSIIGLLLIFILSH